MNLGFGEINHASTVKLLTVIALALHEVILLVAIGTTIV